VLLFQNIFRLTPIITIFQSLRYFAEDAITVQLWLYLKSNETLKELTA